MYNLVLALIYFRKRGCLSHIGERGVNEVTCKFLMSHVVMIKLRRSSLTNATIGLMDFNTLVLS